LRLYSTFSLVFACNQQKGEKTNGGDCISKDAMRTVINSIFFLHDR